MEKNKKDQILGSASSQQSQTIEPQSKQDKAATLGPGTKLTPASRDIAPKSRQQQHPPIVPWSYTPQSAAEQFMAVSMPKQAPSPGLLNQWQQGQMLAQSTPPPTFWQPQWPAGAGGPFLGANVPPIYQTFTSLGTTDPSWQGAVPGGTSSTTQTPVPNMCYPAGYTFPGFPGTCDPSTWHQLQHPYVYNFPGALGFSSATSTTPGCSASGEQSSQIGIIRPTAKLSQKHQQLWEAQSAANFQLWSVMNKLQAEVSDYKDRLTKLEEEVSSLKQKVAAPRTEVNGNIPLGTGQTAKRGRPPKRSLTSVCAFQESPPRTRGRKPAPSKAQFEIKSPIFEKVILKKADNKGIANHSTTTDAQQQTNGKILNAVRDVSGNIQNNQSNSLLSPHEGPVLQEYKGPQTCGSGTAYASGERVYFKNLDLLSAYHVLPGPAEVTFKDGIISARYLGNTGNGINGSTSCISSQNSARELLDAARQGFFHGGSVTKQEQGAKVTPGQNFANEEDASEELEDTDSGSAEDENEDDMGDDTSSTGEEIGVPKDVDGCAMK